MENRDKRYQRAVKQVKDQRSWYSHFFIYLIINIGLQLFYSGVFEGGQFIQNVPWWVRFTTPFFWGISVVIHYLYVFRPGLWKNNFFKRWEKNKIEEFMRKDEEEFKVRFRNEGK